MVEQLTAVDLVRDAIPADDELQRVAFEEYLASRTGSQAVESGLAPADVPTPDTFFFMLQIGKECISQATLLLSAAASGTVIAEWVSKWRKPARLSEDEADRIARMMWDALVRNRPRIPGADDAPGPGDPGSR